MSRIFLLDGHPDPSPERLCAALADAYAGGARRSGHEVRRFDLGAMEFPLLRTRDDFEHGAVCKDVAHVQDALRWADHIVVFHPLWMGSQPALLKGLFEQVFRYGFVLSNPEDKRSTQLLKGKSAHIVMTMGMSAFSYRWYYGAHAMRALERSLLRFVGISPVRRTLIGGAEELSQRKRRNWLNRMREFGAQAQ
ncbi:MAG: NAD(P)H-dependent oxidoreductase [Alphaproteobacteria bacterium]|nr:NAD(P)H-dependent oxidoreductase [Alphaproteobacteria bacterium]